MRLKHNLSGEEFDAIVFDGENFPYSHKDAKGTKCSVTGSELPHDSYEVELDSPSGEKAQCHIAAGQYLLTDADGRVTACPPAVVARDYTEVE